MAQFIHLTEEKSIKAIKKNGICLKRITNYKPKGIYCTPVSEDYYRSHQWTREIRRTGKKAISAIQFKIEDQEKVLIGKYNEEHIAVTSAEAVKIFREHKTGMGLEVIVLRKIKSKEISRIYTPNQLVGWRYYPEAKGNQPFCRCQYCNRGQINAQKIIGEE